MCSGEDMRQLTLITVIFMLQAYRGEQATSMRAAKKSSAQWCHQWRYLACEFSLSSTQQSNCKTLHFRGLHSIHAESVLVVNFPFKPFSTIITSMLVRHGNTPSWVCTLLRARCFWHLRCKMRSIVFIQSLKVQEHCPACMHS